MSSRWLFVLLIVFVACLTGRGDAYQNLNKPANAQYAKSVPKDKKVLSARDSQITPSQIGQIKIVEEKYVAPSQTPTPSPTRKVEGVSESKQVDTQTWSVQITPSHKNASAQEILTALNSYRQKKGVAPLSYDSGLGAYAQTRANFFASGGALDGHAGFMDYINNQDGFGKLGFSSLGENSSLGFMVDGVRLIEGIYAGDKPHDDNQLSSKWSHVGIGVSGLSTDLIFGGGKR